MLVRLLVRGADQSTLTETSLYRGAPPAVAAPVYVNAGSADRSAKEDETSAAVPADREEVKPVAPLEQPLNQTPQKVQVNTASAGQITATAPRRRRLVLPPAIVPRPAEPLLPAPPAIAETTGGGLTPVIPLLLPAPASAPAPRNQDDQGPHSGKIIWTGKLARSGTIRILGDHASQGHLTGGLPGVPVRVQVFPSELIPEGLRIFAADPSSIGPPEAPGAQNGWNRTVYVLNPRKAGEIAMLETPGQANAWNRLTLRAERGDHSIIVLRWERIAAAPAHRAAGNR